MDRDDSLTINWNEWRDYLVMYPSCEIEDIYKHWRHAAVRNIKYDFYFCSSILKLPLILLQAMDIGEPAAVPDDYTEAELKSGAWWRHLLAGAMAGAVSRTCTAPFDRLKLTLMVCNFFSLFICGYLGKYVIYLLSFIFLSKQIFL